MKPYALLENLELARRWRLLAGTDRIPLVSSRVELYTSRGRVSNGIVADLSGFRYRDALAVLDFALAARRGKVDAEAIARETLRAGGVLLLVDATSRVRVFNGRDEQVFPGPTYPASGEGELWVNGLQWRGFAPTKASTV